MIEINTLRAEKKVIYRDNLGRRTFRTDPTLVLTMKNDNISVEHAFQNLKEAKRFAKSIIKLLGVD